MHFLLLFARGICKRFCIVQLVLDLMTTGALPPAPVTVENTAGPPGAGLFMADKDYLFYKPSTASASPPTGAMIGGQEVLLEADGVLGHSWVNLSFAYSSWNVVSEGGYVPSQSAMVSGEPLGAVRVRNSSQVTFSGCDIQHIGGAWALSISGMSATCVPLLRHRSLLSTSVM